MALQGHERGEGLQPTLEGWKVYLCASASDELGKSETTQLQRVCVYGLCESRQTERETEPAVIYI